MKRISILLLVFCTCFALAAWSQAFEDRQPQFIMFDAPDGGNGNGQGTIAIDINSEWAITGLYLDSNNVFHGFVRYPWGKITEFDAPDAGKNGNYYQGTVAININDWGAITGQYEDSNNVYHGFVRYPWGNITEFDAPDAGKIPDCQCQGTIPLTINDRGAITGFYLDSNYVYHGFVRDPWGNITEFDAPDAGTGTGQGTFMDTYIGLGHHINSEGAITGGYVDSGNVYHGFLRHPDGVFTEFEPPGGGTSPGPVTYAHTVLSDGWIVGTFQDHNYGYHAYVRRPDGTFIEFEAPGAGDGNLQGTGGHDINPKHVVAGPVIDGNGYWRGYLRASDGKITEFEAPGAGPLPSQGTSTFDINSAGAIVGCSTDSNNVNHGFLRMP